MARNATIQKSTSIRLPHVKRTSGKIPLSSRQLAGQLEWARALSAWIVEDDFDNEYRFRGRPLPSLQGMDEHDRALYVGTFDRTLSSSWLRNGWASG